MSIVNNEEHHDVSSMSAEDIQNMKEFSRHLEEQESFAAEPKKLEEIQDTVSSSIKDVGVFDRVIDKATPQDFIIPEPGQKEFPASLENQMVPPNMPPHASSHAEWMNQMMHCYPCVPMHIHFMPIPLPMFAMPPHMLYPGICPMYNPPFHYSPYGPCMMAQCFQQQHYAPYMPPMYHHPAMFPPQAFAPQQMAFAPQQMAFAPQQMAFAPQQMAFAPQQMAFAPQQMAFAPQQMAFAPQQMAFAPQQMAFAPQQMAFAPQQIAYPPQQPANIDNTDNIEGKDLKESSDDDSVDQPSQLDEVFNVDEKNIISDQLEHPSINVPKPPAENNSIFVDQSLKQSN